MDLGQNLLTDPATIARIIKAADVRPDDRVLDAGAGAGALTRPLAALASQVYAVDLDPAMVKALSKDALPNVTVVADNLLTWELPDLSIVVANLPFKIAAPLIERLAQFRGVYVVPRELADRLCAQPGSEHYGKLSIRVGLKAKVEDLGFMSRHAFTPPPAVTCGIIRLRPRDRQEVDDEMLDDVLDSAWQNWEKKARRAFSALAPKYRVDGAGLAAFLQQHGWSDVPVNQLAPGVFAMIANHLSAGRKARE